MPNPPGSFIWYELMSPEPAGSASFYGSVVGWKVGEPVAEGLDYRMLGRDDGGNAGGLMGLDDQMTASGARPTWMGYVGVDDVDAKVARAGELGGSVLMPPWDQPGVGRLAMIADPQGNPLYLMKPLPPEGQPDATSDVFSPDQPQRVSWNELTTADPAAARAFYGALFGWGSDDFMDMGEYGEYRFLTVAGQQIGALCGVMPGGTGGWRYYIRVPSIGRAVEALKAGGGAVTMGPHQVPTGDHITIGNDPQGAEFALVGQQ